MTQKNDYIAQIIGLVVTQMCCHLLKNIDNPFKVDTTNYSSFPAIGRGSVQSGKLYRQ